MANHFRHNFRVNLPSYLLQSLSNSTLAIQRDPTGEHACHEGLMVLVMNVLKSKKIPKPRTIKGEDQDTEGSFQEKGYDSETHDEMEERLVSTKIGLVGSSKKKKQGSEKDDSDRERESDFVEEIVREHAKNRGGITGKGKDCAVERDYLQSDDEPIAKRLESKRKLFRRLGKKKVKPSKEESNSTDHGEEGSNSEGGHGVGKDFRPSKGLIGNPGSIMKDIDILKHKMVLLNKEMEHLSKTARGERTLGQHIDKLSEVIGNAEEVKNLMHKIPVLEAKQKVMDKDISSIQGRLTKVETRLGNMDKHLRQLGDNMTTFLKNEAEKSQVSPMGVDSQGPSKRTRANAKKMEENSKKEEVQAAAETMHSLVDQAVHLMNIPCWSFAVSLLVFCCLFQLCCL